MRTKTTTIGLMFATMAGLSAFAQVTNLNQVKATPEVKTAAIAFAQNVESSKALMIAAYPTFAPDIVVDGKKHQWGAGVAALYPIDAIPALSQNVVAQHAFAGLRLDLLGGKFFASTVAVGAKAHVQVYGRDFLVFAESGANIPISGAGDNNAELGAMVGTGVSTRIYSFGKADANGVKPGGIDAFGCAEKWTLFPGYVLHAGAAVSWHF